MFITTTAPTGAFSFSLLSGLASDPNRSEPGKGKRGEINLHLAFMAGNGYGNKGADMNRQTISKLADFLLNCTVASFAVSVFGDKPWGAAVGVIFFMGALTLCHYLGGEK